ncbi:deoxyguanosinetriphosphate triphosphohydrolase [candidate division CSSED10-310 bacterium]|uniref:Deoxyguanosinetriphosphate triphosphohydrolase-like protein n=1 Tax=candidate division CSSED10-310 bacterium TaxID=2855610 RepID=A0ABV6YXT6_UNCC1
MIRRGDVIKYTIYHREDWEKIEEMTLAPFAVRASQSKGRVYSENPPPHRTCFHRDRDRIIHSNAFRRLEYKTQVFVNYEGDHYRTRLTHTLEVAQTAVSISRALRLNTDLTDVIAMAHDLGHTPFGHAGEETLHQLMKDYGGFEHNRQSLRVVDVLEERYQAFPGLNLSWEAREGIIKHNSAYDNPSSEDFNPGKKPSLEGQVVNLADEIAYNCHDLEDGLRSEILTPAQLSAVVLWQEVLQRAQKEGDFKSSDQLQYQTVRHLKNTLLLDAFEASQQAIQNSQVQTVDHVRSHPADLILLSPAMARKNQEFREFLFHNLYNHYRIIRMADKARFFITRLFERYQQRPDILPSKVHLRLAHSDEPERIICDYIAGMTDRYALDEYQKLFDPYEKV